VDGDGGTDPGRGDRRASLRAGAAGRPPLHLSAYALTLIGKIMCFALAAMRSTWWGYCGILSLGHGLFFALGGYAMGMYLMRSIGREGVYKSDLPDFMVFLDWKELPWFWHGTEHFPTRCCWWCWCRACWPGCSASSRSVAHQGRVPVDHHAGHDAPRCCCSSATRRASAATTASPTSSASPALPWPRRTRAALFVLTFLALLAGFIACRYIVTSSSAACSPCAMPRCA
jgi:urea transport system permease protein